MRLVGSSQLVGLAADRGVKAHSVEQCLVPLFSWTQQVGKPEQSGKTKSKHFMNNEGKNSLLTMRCTFNAALDGHVAVQQSILVAGVE